MFSDASNKLTLPVYFGLFVFFLPKGVYCFQMLANVYYCIPSSANLLTNDFLSLSWRHSYAIHLNDDSLIHLPKQ